MEIPRKKNTKHENNKMVIGFNKLKHGRLAHQPASGEPAVQSWPAWGLLPPTPHREKKASGGPAVQSPEVILASGPLKGYIGLYQFL